MKNLKYLLLLVVAGNLALAAVVFLGSSSPKPTPMPNPNGYDEFVKAIPLLNGSPNDYPTMGRDELAVLVSTNDQVLKFIVLGTSQQSRVPEDYSDDYVKNILINRLAAFKKMVFLFCAEGKLAELDGHTNDAAKFYLEGIRFGQESSRGGVEINKLVGIACESAAMEKLRATTTNLEAKQCAKIARELENVDAQAEPVEETIKQEKIFARKVYGIKGQFLALIMYKTIRANQERFLKKFASYTTSRRELMIAFAARAYELEKGKRPASLADLVPEYLKSIPQDPVTGTNMVYSPR